MEHPGDRIRLHLFHKILNGQAGVVTPVRVFKGDVSQPSEADFRGTDLPGDRRTSRQASFWLKAYGVRDQVSDFGLRLAFRVTAK